MTQEWFTHASLGLTCIRLLEFPQQCSFWDLLFEPVLQAGVVSGLGQFRWTSHEVEFFFHVK